VKRGRYSLKQQLAELQAEVSRLKNQPAPKATLGPSSAGQVDGTLVATLTGHVAVGGTRTPITWTKVVSDGDDIAFDGSLIETDRDGSYTFAHQFSGKWPAGFHRFDWIDGVSLAVLNTGNMNADPMVCRVPVNRGQVGHAVVNGYGNTIAFGVTSNTTHQEPLGGQSYAVPTRIDITCYVTRQMEG